MTFVLGPDAALARTSSARSRCLDPQGAPVVGAHVNVSCLVGFTAGPKAVTDEQGRFVARDLMAGRVPTARKSPDGSATSGRPASTMAESMDRDTALALLLPHQDAVFNAAHHLLGDRGLAEDTLQDTFLALLQQPRPPQQPRAWLLTVALNRVRDRLRRPVAAADDGELDAIAARTPAPPLLAEQGERCAAVAAALQRLPLPQREVVVLHAFEELPFRAIGELCGISADTAASRWRYACDRLRRQLSRDWSPGGRR